MKQDSKDSLGPETNEMPLNESGMRGGSWSKAFVHIFVCSCQQPKRDLDIFGYHLQPQQWLWRHIGMLFLFIFKLLLKFLERRFKRLLLLLNINQLRLHRPQLAARLHISCSGIVQFQRSLVEFWLQLVDDRFLLSDTFLCCFCGKTAKQNMNIREIGQKSDNELN